MNEQQGDRKKIKAKQSDHSLGPDIYTGWQSKTLLPKLKQIPLVFAHVTTDLISKTLTSFGSQRPHKVVYMGFRPASNMKAYKEYGQNKHHKYVTESFLYSKKPVKRFKFQHFQEPQKYFPIRPSEYRLFKGINPTWKNQDIKFSSQFQGGNLDLAIAVNPNEYDLLMRVDSNTKGHTCWYFFKVFDIKKKKKVKFNIINFTKNQLLYTEGMKPYVFRTSKMQWSQEGVDVEFKNKAIRYFSDKDEHVASKCLSFTYEFQDLNEQVYFAYSIPYSYSYLLEFLQELLKKHNQFIKVNYDYESTGGIPLPVVTITNFTKQSEKKHHLAIGRLHPGQPQGSWIMEGFMRFLCSPSASYIRDKVVFKIIPMANVDGVVLGNFRTGVNGRDLNRMFNNCSNFNETRLIKNIAQEFKPEVFLDFHGHSARKNVFIYGPQYKIEDPDYIRSRIFPKIISKKTEAFRYYSCIFKISESKVNTGRALLFYSHKTRFVFTIEASTHGFGHGKDTEAFSCQKYIEVGWTIADSLQQFVRLLLNASKRNELLSLDNVSSSNSLNKDERKSRKKIENIQELMVKDNLTIDNFFEGMENDIEKQLIMEIMENEKENDKNINQQKKQNPQSDSDCENPNQDYTQKQLKLIQKTNGNQSIENILKSISKTKKRTSTKKSKNLRESKSKSKNFNTIDLIPNKQLNNNLTLSKQSSFSRDLSIDKNRNLNYFDQINKSDSKIKLKPKNQQNSYTLKNSKEDDDSCQNLRKLDAWKSSQFKKYRQLQPINLSRNKSANQVFLQGPPEKEIQPLHKIMPKIKSQSTRKKQPILMIRKSPFLPTVVIKQSQKSQLLQSLDDSECRANERRSLISEILQMHDKKTKRKHAENPNRKYKIAFYEG